MDQGTNLNFNGNLATWFEQGFVRSVAGAGLPDGAFNSFSQPTHHYQFADFSGNNAILIDTNHQSANIALATHMAKHGGLPWDVILGAEVTGAYKPSGEAYRGAARRLDLRPEECMMVAAHPTDLEAAASRGFRTAYVHRPLEEGAGREAPWPAAGAFDYAVADFLALADALGA